MSQKRYADYKSAIGSKNSVEHGILTNGMGPVLGFDKVSNIAINNNVLTFKIGTNQTSGNNPLRRHAYLSDKDSEIVNPVLSVVTPDGIITMFDTEQELSINLTGATVFDNVVELLLVATHYYVEDTQLMTDTSLRLESNKGQVSTLTTIKPTITGNITELLNSYPTINAWLDLPMASSMDHSSEVIVALIRINISTISLVSIDVPYKYIWPQPKIISDAIWDKTMSLIDSKLSDLIGGQIPIGGTMEWPGPLSTKPANFLVQDGSWVYKSQRPELFTVLGGEFNVYGYDYNGGNEKFKLPYVPAYGTPVQNDSVLKGLAIKKGGSGFTGVGNQGGFALSNGAIGKILTVDGNGAITSISLLTPGNPVGNGEELTITNLQYGSGSGAILIAIIDEVGGEKTHALTPEEGPVHHHKMFLNRDASTGGTSEAYTNPEWPAVMQDLGANTDREYQIRVYNDPLSAIGFTPTSEAGSGTAHNNMQPYRTGWWLIRAY